MFEAYQREEHPDESLKRKDLISNAKLTANLIQNKNDEEIEIKKLADVDEKIIEKLKQEVKGLEGLTQ